MITPTKVLVVAEHEHHDLRASSLNTIKAALQCGGELHVLVAGTAAMGAAMAAAKVAGVARVLLADGGQFAHAGAENMVAQVLALMNGEGGG